MSAAATGLGVLSDVGGSGPDVAIGVDAATGSALRGHKTMLVTVAAARISTSPSDNTTRGHLSPGFGLFSAGG